MAPAAWRRLGAIADGDAPDADPAVYHLFVVERSEGGEPVALGDEHSELRWFAPRAASGLPDLALNEYRRVFADAFGPPAR